MRVRVYNETLRAVYQTLTTLGVPHFDAFDFAREAARLAVAKVTNRRSV